MDEVGRGTSTFDGLALAWASAAFLAERIKAFTLFATHYFEMTALPEQYSNTVDVHLKATEHDERIIFLHSVEQGPASQSYGIQVAQLAGVPAIVIEQARLQLSQLEQNRPDAVKLTPGTAGAATPMQSDLFAAIPSATEIGRAHV